MLSNEELQRLKDFILFAKENNITYANLNGLEFKFNEMAHFPAEPDSAAIPVERAPSPESKLGLSKEDEGLLFAAS